MNLIIKVDDSVICDETIEDDYFLESDYKYDEFKRGKSNIEVFINNIQIEPSYIDKFKENCRISKIVE